jgi:hypothetical protein
MPARLDALHGNNIAAGISSGLGLIQRADPPAGQRATAVRQFDQRRPWRLLAAGVAALAEICGSSCTSADGPTTGQRMLTVRNRP